MSGAMDSLPFKNEDPSSDPQYAHKKPSMVESNLTVIPELGSRYGKIPETHWLRMVEEDTRC